MDFVAATRSLSTLALAAGGAGALLLAVLAFPAGRSRLARALQGGERGLLWLAWVTALVATLGSLYYSEVVGFRPCLLCWYQRIAMYPLVLVLGAGALRDDREAWAYGIPLSVGGLGVALYHVIIQFRPALDVAACSLDAPCTARYVAAWGFVSIPFMAACGFLLITALLLAVRTTAAADRSGTEGAGGSGPPPPP